MVINGNKYLLYTLGLMNTKRYLFLNWHYLVVLKLWPLIQLNVTLRKQNIRECETWWETSEEDIIALMNTVCTALSCILLWPFSVVVFIIIDKSKSQNRSQWKDLSNLKYTFVLRRILSFFFLCYTYLISHLP